MNALSFSFENTAVRTLGTPENPLFVALDVCNALQHSNPWKAIKDLCDAEDVSKQELVDVKGRKQTVNCVNESGLYALIFGSKLESAKRFKRWVTSEVLPAIRKQGRYECPAKDQLPPPMLTEQQAYTIMSEVAKRAKNCGTHYQTIYRALKARYQVTKYTHIPREMFDDAVRFIQTVNLRVPEAAPQKTEVPEEKRYVVTKSFLERQRVFVYYWRYLFRGELEIVIKLMRAMESPHAGMLWDAIHNINLVMLEKNLESLGFSIRDLDCYQHWALTHKNA